MDFYTVLDQVIELLRSRGRVSYRALKRQFALDDAYLDDLKAELIEVQQLAVDQEGTMLVWTGRPGATAEPSEQSSLPLPPDTARVEPRPSEAERRQLTVLFCDLVDSTVLASQLDPEEWREVVRAYQDTCAKVIARYEGHIAQYLGDGLLVYFGYPQAHEDDAQRAVRAGLGMVEAMGQLNALLSQEHGVRLDVRLGIHTGLVVVGKVGGGPRQEQLALGETPNVAARLQGLAAPKTLVISATTYRLLGGFFACQSLGPHLLKGFAQPLEVYQVLSERTARTRLEAAGRTGLTPLVGREPEVALLRERWAQVKDGFGQVVLLSGEAGIGKSRLVQVLTEHVAAEPQAWLTPCQCSPYYQNTALYPMVELLERVALRFEREESPEQKRRKLEGFLVPYGLPLAEAVPLFAALLSLPLAADDAPLTMSPEQQKQKTLQAFLTILLRIAAQQPVLFVIEDLHWVDPSTLELLTLLVDQGPTARILALFTFRPDFNPPWTGRSHLTQVTLSRLPRLQAAEMTSRVAHGNALPPEVVEQIVAKTDGVPLFVEELTKIVLESGLLQERDDHYALTGPLPPLAIPTTLHDSLMARLDRLAAVKGLAQLGATLGREFSYELLQAIAPWDEETLRRGLHQLVEAEFLYQQGLPPQATYRFKHALIQDAAYQSLLRSTRQQYHQRIAQVLEARFPERCETQPELLAQHYTGAGLAEQAIPYWQRAGQRAVERSANLEGVAHLRKGLAGLATLPDTPKRLQRELDLLTLLGSALTRTSGPGSSAVEQVYTRARELCQQVEPQQLFPVLWGLWYFYNTRAELQKAEELGKQLLTLAQQVQDRTLLLEAHHALWPTLFFLGELAAARGHLERGMALYDLQDHRSHAFLYGGHDPGSCCKQYTAWTLWALGYPDQALQSSQALRNLSKPLQSWKANRTTMATEVALEFIDREASVMAFPLQDTKRDQTAGEMMLLRPLRTRLTALQPKLILAHSDDFFDLRTPPIEAADLCGRQGQAIGRVVLGAVSDDQDLEPAPQPTRLRPIRMPPIGSEGLAIEPAVLLEATHEIPAIIPHPLQQGFRRVPGIKEDVLRATTQPIASVAEQLQGQRILGGTSLVPQPYTQWNAQVPICPDQQDQGETIHRLALLAGIHPGQAFHSRGKRFRHDRVIKDELPPFPDEQCATDALQEFLPGPVGLQHSRQAVMRHSLQGLRQGHTRGRCAIIQQGGEVEPNQRWHRVPSFVMVGWKLYPISPLLRNP
jgi:class 3 adenylate cyclase